MNATKNFSLSKKIQQVESCNKHKTRLPITIKPYIQHLVINKPRASGRSVKKHI